MRGRLLVLAGLSVIMLSIGKLPEVVLSTMPAVEYVRPERKTLQQEVSCIGVVYAENEQEIYLESPVLASQVFVSVGDVVGEDTLLASIDVAKTQKILETAPALPTPDEAQLEEYQALFGSIAAGSAALGITLPPGVDYGELLSQYQSALGSVNAGERSSKTAVPLPIREELRAPVGGTVTKVGVRANLLSKVGEPAFVITDLTSCKVLASLPQSEVDKVNMRDRVVITGKGMAGKSFPGLVTKIYPTAKRVYSSTAVQEAVVELEITLLEHSPLLRPGYTVTVQISNQDDTPAVTLPYEAVKQDENNVEYVYILAEDFTLRRQNIVTGKETLGSVEVIAGVQPEDVVILAPGGVGEGPVYVKGEAVID